MILKKQLDEIKSLHKNLRMLGGATQPNLERHVMLALVSGEIPKLKSVKAISDTAKIKIVSERYWRSLSFGDVFASTNGYEGEMSVFKTYEKQRCAALAKFDKASSPIMLKALSADADASDIAEQLHEAAERCGLKACEPPVFEQE
jgi:hypothetical protein